MTFLRLLFVPLALCAALSAAEPNVQPGRSEYRLLATLKTSTMEKEMNEAAAAGFAFSSVMGGETSFGGKETVLIMRKAADTTGARSYKLLATNKTSTLDKELNQAGQDGFVYRGVTVFESAFGGREVAVILEHGAESAARYSYRVLATNRTSTMEKELNAAGAEGYQLQGMCVGKTAFGGNEVVSILMRADAR